MFLEKSACPPSGWSPLKIPRHLQQLLAIRILIANSAHSSTYGLFFINTLIRFVSISGTKFGLCTFRGSK